MKIYSPYSEAVYRNPRIDQGHRENIPTSAPVVGDADDFFRNFEEKSILSETKTVLSENERATLHMLFGSVKPEELNFYGKNRVSHIHKGQLIDLVG